MFGGSRRHRTPVQPLTKETANPNAATAAASAFMRRDQSAPPSLSSAAAAAALRARPMTPTNVAEVQSKRVARRSPSVSSTASRDKGRPGLQRSPSTGSLTERTFRSPSPGRGHALPHDAPPVPAIPSQVMAKPPNGSARLTLQTQTFRTASQKAKDGQRGGTWFGAATPGDTANVRKADAALQSSANMIDRSGSISPSINFSRPRASSESPKDRIASPWGEPAVVYDPNSRRMVPTTQLRQAQHDVREASEKPVKKNKKKQQDLQRSGSHLSKGTVARTQGTVLGTPTTYTAANNSRVEEHREPVRESEPRSEQETFKAHDDYVDQPSTIAEPAEDPTPTSLGVLPAGHAESSSLPLEEPREELEDDTEAPQNYITPAAQQNGHTAVPGKVASGHGIENEVERRSELSEEVHPAVATTSHSGVRNARVHSESPARTARFAPPSEHLAVRHEPPPRSLSPRKSALKQRSPSRGVSPSDDGSEASSSLAQAVQDDGSVARRKSVRVSFNDEKNVVMGESSPSAEAHSPTLPSPQTKKPWHTLVGKFNKKGSPALEEDETMTPRPALPLFGSVRDKKTRELEERPLVRPIDHARSPPPGQQQLSEDQEDDVHSLSNDHALNSRNEANTSKYREPLPPVVTSIDGSGYVSNSDSSSDEETETEDYHTAPHHLPESVNAVLNVEAEDSSAHPAVTSLESQQPKEVTDIDSRQQEAAPVDSAQNSDNVPKIAVLAATPNADESATHEDRDDFFDVPGGFPDEMEDSPIDDIDTGKRQIITEPTPATSVAPPLIDTTSEETVQAPLSTSSSQEFATPISPMANIREEEDSDANSIYSDAYEDISEPEGDGFLSLDAVLTTPIKEKRSENIPELTNSRVKDIISQKKISVQPPQGISSSDENHSPSSKDWENAKAYWRSLSATERRKLEKEAMDDTESELKAKQETQQDTKPKTKKNKKPANGTITVANPAEPAKSDDRTYQIKPGTKWAQTAAETRHPENAAHHADKSGSVKLRKLRQQDSGISEVGSTISNGTIRKSMRSNKGASLDSSSNAMPKTLRGDRPEPVASTEERGMRKSLRNSQPPPPRSAAGVSSKAQERPASYHPTSSTALAKAIAARTQSNDFSGTQKGLVRRGSDASESSFTRSRGKDNENQGFRRTMRVSVREAPPAPAYENVKSSRFSLRSLSPTGSTTRRESFTTGSPMGGGRMRQSLRSSSTDAASSRIRMPSFGLSSSKKVKKQGGSRFDDSSDEEDGPSRFQSRFADSSDEEDVFVSSPARQRFSRPKSSGSAVGSGALMNTLPVQREEQSSPELPDSSDDEDEQAIVQPKRNSMENGFAASNLHRSGSGRGNLSMRPAALGTAAIGGSQSFVRPAQKRRGSFMSVVLRRKTNSGKIARNVSESAARRDTKLERSTGELSVMRSNSSSKNNSTARLQRRAPDWPLSDKTAPEPSAPADADHERPSTANPSGPPQRIGFLRRRSTSHSVAVSMPTTLENGDSPKKKRFGSLRKMFKIHD